MSDQATETTFDVEACQARCEAFLEAFDTTGLKLRRYDNGGGRAGVFDGHPRRLVAVFFHEPEREFFWGAVTDLPAALDEIERLRAQIERLVAVHNEEFLASAARFSALIEERDRLRYAYDELAADGRSD